MSSTARSTPEPQRRSKHREAHADREPTSTERVEHHSDRRDVVDHEKDRHGGIKIGSAFFGWLTATGMTVLLTALAAAIGAAVGAATGIDPSTAADQATNSIAAVSLVGGIVLVVILFVAYFCGGYVAGRMARFSGLKQGLTVWLWSIVIAILVAILATVAGSQFNVLSQLNSFPRVPVNPSDMTLGGIIAAVAIVLASLVGALLGGLAGMRFHRKVDKTGLGS